MTNLEWGTLNPPSSCTSIPIAGIFYFLCSHQLSNVEKCVYDTSDFSKPLPNFTLCTHILAALYVNSKSLTITKVHIDAKYRCMPTQNNVEIWKWFSLLCKNVNACWKSKSRLNISRCYKCMIKDRSYIYSYNIGPLCWVHINVWTYFCITSTELLHI